MRIAQARRLVGGPLPGARFVVSALLVLSSLGCAQDRAPESRTLEWTEIPMPVGQGSEVPHLSNSDDAVLMSWIEPVAGRTHAVRVAGWDGVAWSPPLTIAESEDFFVNWADFPSAVETESGDWVAHWLARGPQGGYDYGVRMAGGQPGAITAPWSPHDDQSPSEHGFVTTVPLDGDALGVTWLDGRNFPVSEAPEMQLRYRTTGPEGPRAPEVLLDGRTCECCQTDAARTGQGLVVVYRDRSPDDIRDIAIVREGADGSWSEPTLVHPDGWHIGGCPVNGPAVDAEADRVVVAWFTGGQDDPRVQVAFSTDAGATFGPPTRVDGGNPVGRVDVVLLDEGAVVSWIEQGGDAASAEINLRTASADGRLGPVGRAAPTSPARRSGFPQMVRHGEDLVLAWHDVDASRVRGALLPLEAIR